MRIGIDISQIVYEETGVGNYVRKLVKTLLFLDSANEYVLFGASLRMRSVFEAYYRSLGCDITKVKLRVIPIPPTLLDILWNRLHVIPVEWFIGHVDVFWSSDWTQPPLAQAHGITTVHDLSIFKYPKSFHRRILSVQKRRLIRAKAECGAFLCDSEATQKDLIDLLHVDRSRTSVVYPGFSL